MIIQHNIQAIFAKNNLIKSGNHSKNNVEKLSSGYRINKAADDASGLAVSEKMRTLIRGLARADENCRDGINMVQTAEGGLNEISNMLQRIRELAVKSANGTYTDDERAIIDDEVQALLSEITATAEKTDFNGIPLLSPRTIIKSALPDDSPLAEIVKKIKKPSDIVFTIDISGSMGMSLDYIIGNIKAFINEIPPGSSVAFLLYSDISLTTPETAIYKDFETDPKKMADFLDSISLYGGGDIPESGLDGLNDSIDAVKSSSKEKHIIYITDAESHNGPPKSAFTVSDINTALKNNKITLHAIGPTSGIGKTQIDDLVKDTGGDTYDVNDTKVAVVPPVFEELTDIILQIGAYGSSYETLSIQVDDMSAEGLDISALNVRTERDAVNAIETADFAINRTVLKRTYFGAIQNRLEATIDNLNTLGINSQSSESRIRDADMASEMVGFMKNKIISQTAQAVLTQANQMPQGILGLLM